MRKLRNINRSLKHADLIDLYAKKNHPVTGKSIFPTIKDLLCFCAMLGYAENRRVEFDKKWPVEDVMYEIFQKTHADDFVYMIALAKAQDVSIFKDESPEDFVKIFEEYANGGLETLAVWLKEFPDENGEKALFLGLKKHNYLPSGQEVSLDTATANFEV